MHCKSCSLCLLRESEVAPFLETLHRERLRIALHSSYGALKISIQGHEPVDDIVEKIEKRFPTFFLGEEEMEWAICRHMQAQKKKLALAESCTGGAITALLVSVPGASQFLMGAVVAYSDEWKERFLGVRRDTLLKKGAVSREAVAEMIEGLFAETGVDFAIAVSGIMGPGNGIGNKPVGTVYIGIGKRGEKADIGVLQAPLVRKQGIAFSVQIALGALWRRLAHHAMTFS